MLNILDYLLEHEPEIYETCRYTVIEISPLLVKAQLVEKRHIARVDIINKSVFEWDRTEEEACFVMAHEVIVSFRECLL
jgi:SAM-dependent MidA family methyltransferase